MLSGAARLGGLEAVLGPSRGQVSLGPYVGALGSMLGQVGPILGPGWAYVGLCWLYAGPMLAHVSPILAHLALCWPYVGPTLAYVGPMLAHLGAYVEAMLAICETISVERPPRCFLPGPLRGTKRQRN